MGHNFLFLHISNNFCFSVMCIIDTRLLSIWILSSFVIEFCFGRWLISLCISLFLFLSFNKSGSGLSLFPRCGISGSLMNPGVFNEVSNWMFGTQIPPSHVQASIVVQLMLLGSCSWPTWVEFCSVPDQLSIWPELLYKFLKFRLSTVLSNTLLHKFQLFRHFLSQISV